MLRLERITNMRQLSEVMDFVIEGSRNIIAKTGNHGQGPEQVIGLAMKADLDRNVYLLVGYDDETMVGFALALFIPGSAPWVDFIALYSKPGWARKAQEAAYRDLAEWAKSMGAKYIRTIITRSPRLFYESFHKKLGFKPVGLLLEVEV